MNSFPSHDKVFSHKNALIDIVKAIQPVSEAHPMALLSQLMASFGSAIGQGPYFSAEADKHSTNLFVLNIGDSAKGRKGTSWGHIERIMKEAVPNWVSLSIKSGLGSGEGLIWALRDEEFPESESASVTKNILLMESEFGGLLQVVNREGNTVSANLRNAWDGKPLSNITKGTSAKATDHHVSVVGHITKTELLLKLKNVEVMNGLGNRFLFFAVKRFQLLPDGGRLELNDLRIMGLEIRESVSYAKSLSEIKRDSGAQEYWRNLYFQLADGEAGLVGALSSRTEAQIMRLALINALFARRNYIAEEDLMMAKDVHQYSIDSLKYLFGEKTGFPFADSILELIKLNPSGVTRTQIYDKFSRNVTKDNLTQAISILQESKLIFIEEKVVNYKTVEFLRPLNSVKVQTVNQTDELYEQGYSYNSSIGE